MDIKAEVPTTQYMYMNLCFAVWYTNETFACSTVIKDWGYLEGNRRYYGSMGREEFIYNQSLITDQVQSWASLSVYKAKKSSYAMPSPYKSPVTGQYYGHRCTKELSEILEHGHDYLKNN